MQTALPEPQYVNLEYIFNKIYHFFQSIIQFLFNQNTEHTASQGFTFNTLLTILCLFFLVMMAYCAVRLLEIRAKEHKHLAHELHEYAEHQAHKQHTGGPNHIIVNERWENALAYLKSENPSDWKLAVMEADTMLEDLTDTLELEGENLGERLKSATKERFKSLDEAWGAHIVRNRIAHEGSRFDLTKREAERALFLYEKVFQEFGII